MEQIRILLVDNHPEVLKQVQTRLSYEEDFYVCEGSSLSRVSEKLIECHPDVLLIDPYVNNGFDFECIKLAKKKSPTITVIVLTAVVDSAAHKDLTQAGAEYILEKSIDSDELVNTLRKVMVKEKE
jgi:DNA-binding NarL/FixJ family response regulator